MARSLSIKYKTYEERGWKENILFSNNGIGFATITLPCEGIRPLEIEVFVDIPFDEEKQKFTKPSNNASFTVESYTKWFNYEIKRIEDGDNSYVKILLMVDKNLNTLSRLGEMRIMHNAAPLTINLEIIQKPSVYSISVKYGKEEDGIFKKEDGIFKSFPKDCLYEEKTVTVNANGGSGKWYVKDIEQYEAHDTFEGEGTINGDEITKADRKNEMRVPYDGALKYFIDGNKLTVRSFGKVDLCEEDSHMRYYFRICHKDVGNSLKKYNPENSQFEVSQLFIFDNDNGEKY